MTFSFFFTSYLLYCLRRIEPVYDLFFVPQASLNLPDFSIFLTLVVFEIN